MHTDYSYQNWPPSSYSTAHGGVGRGTGDLASGHQLHSRPLLLHSGKELGLVGLSREKCNPQKEIWADMSGLVGISECPRNKRCRKINSARYPAYNKMDSNLSACRASALLGFLCKGVLQSTFCPCVAYTLIKHSLTIKLLN